MSQYKNVHLAQAGQFNTRATKTFDQGTAARDTSDSYVRYTVLLASVLFLVALAQRLRDRIARISLNVVAFGVLVYALSEVMALPRL